MKGVTPDAPRVLGLRDFRCARRLLSGDGRTKGSVTLAGRSAARSLDLYIKNL